jgi:hypothetical protein
LLGLFSSHSYPPLYERGERSRIKNLSDAVPWYQTVRARRWPDGERAADLARLKASFPTPCDAVASIMDTFPIVRRKDEAKCDGAYRTGRDLEFPGFVPYDDNRIANFEDSCDDHHPAT